MKRVLVTGGTVFVSRYIAEYFVKQQAEVYVLNRNTRKQSQGVTLIQADRHDLGDTLRNLHFDVVIDTAYTGDDVRLLLDALGSFDDYIFISSSAVYPQDNPQPFREDGVLGVNSFWGQYGLDKIDAETTLRTRVPHAYLLRPPYLYGEMNNVYREAFVFDCALSNRAFYLPRDGEMKLQFFHIDDLCRLITIILRQKPDQHIFNVGNNEVLSIREWVELCYDVVGRKAKFVNVYDEINQRTYFSFYDYEYRLDVSFAKSLMADTIPMAEGLKRSYQWYKEHSDQVVRKPYLDYIDQHLR